MAGGLRLPSRLTVKFDLSWRRWASNLGASIGSISEAAKRTFISVSTSKQWQSANDGGGVCVQKAFHLNKGHCT